MSLAAVFAFLSANNADVIAFRYLFITFTCLQSIFIVIAYIILSKEVPPAFCCWLMEDTLSLHRALVYLQFSASFILWQFFVSATCQLAFYMYR